VPTIEETVALIAGAATWTERVARIRQIPAHHGTDDRRAIHAQVAKLLYVPHLAPDYAYVHSAEFYDAPHFQAAYDKAADSTAGFTNVSVSELAAAIQAEPTILLVLRVITGLTKGEFAASTVSPAPDFVVYDHADTLRALLECKGANDGGTARDKALRFERLRTEANRLGGIPLLAVLGGLGWTRVNDTLGPVVRDCDGRVFSVANLHEMLTVAPFPTL
jgi:hypothetical protein